MEKRTVRRENRRIRRRKQYRLCVGSIIFILLLLPAVLLTGAARNTTPIAGPPDFTSAGGRPVVAPAQTKAEKIPAEETQPEEAKNTDPVDSDRAWYLTLVNRWNPIPENYAVNLVEVTGGELVDERIYGPLTELLEAAREDNLGQLPLVVSGYRTQEKQRQLYEDRIAEYRSQGYSEDKAKELAEQWVAVPGYSEHQLGFAVDLNGATYDVYLWLQENSYKYGFIFRYPGSKTEITGTAEEVWHYRYVGVAAATEMYEQGICLEEYLENLYGKS